MSDDVTFRDFAGAVMGGDAAAAGGVLEKLLDLSPEQASAAAGHFQAQMSSGPEFMGKAMGLRQVVQSGDAGAISQLLGEVFGLEGEALEGAAAEIGRRYS
jgi:hypothetical protein